MNIKLHRGLSIWMDHHLLYLKSYKGIRQTIGFRSQGWKRFSAKEIECPHSSVGLSAPSILPPRVWIPSTPSMLLFELKLWHDEKTKINRKRGRNWPIFNKLGSNGAQKSKREVSKGAKNNLKYLFLFTCSHLLPV